MKKLLALAAGVVLAGIAYEMAGSRRDRRRFPPPGRLVGTIPPRLHLYERGSGSPAVILEAGLAASSLSWSLVQPAVAKFTRVCSYDRAGFGWSDAVRGPLELKGIVEDLHALLIGAEIPPPYILVGHSFGGLIVRAFAIAHADRVAGLVLVDPVSINRWSQCEGTELKRLRLGILLSRRGAFLARLGIVRASLAMLLSGARLVPKLVARASASKGVDVVTKLTGEVSKLPRELWPVIQAHWARPESFSSMAIYLESLPGSARATAGMSIPEYIPVTIISAATATPEELAERDSWVDASERGKSLVAEHSGHFIQWDEPELVIAAINDMRTT